MEDLKTNFEALIEAIVETTSTLETSEHSLNEIREKVGALEAELENTKQALTRRVPSKLYKVHEPEVKDHHIKHFLAQDALKQEAFAKKVMGCLELSLEEQQIDQSLLKDIAVLAEETNALWHAFEKERPDGP
jgi:hypothetical protein